MNYVAGSLLVSAGLLQHDQLVAAQRLRQRDGLSLGEAVVNLGYASEEQLVSFYHKRLLVPRLGPFYFTRLSSEILDSLPVDMAAEFRVFPVGVDDHDGVLTLAMADPSDAHAVDEIRFFTGRFIERVVASESTIRSAIERHYGVELGVGGKVARTAKVQVAPMPEAQLPSALTVADGSSDEAPDGEGEPLLLTQVKQPELTPLPVPFLLSDVLIPPAAVDDPSLDAVTIVDAADDAEPIPLDRPIARPDGAPAADGEPILLDRPRAARRRRATLPGVPAPATAELHLAALQEAKTRDEASRLLLDYLAGIASRVALFVLRDGRLVGHDGRGFADPTLIRRTTVALQRPSLFYDIVATRLPYRGPQTSAEEDLAFAARVEAPPGNLLVLPIEVRDRVVALAWAGGVRAILPDLRAVAKAAGAAYERAILAAKAQPKPPA